MRSEFFRAAATSSDRCQDYTSPNSGHKQQPTKKIENYNEQQQQIPLLFVIATVIGRLNYVSFAFKNFISRTRSKIVHVMPVMYFQCA